MSDEGRRLVVLGKITDAHGLQGWLKVHPFGDDPASWRRIPVWLLRDERGSGEWREFKPIAFRLRNDAILVQFEGVNDRALAETLKGWIIGAWREDLPPTEQDEFYWNDLIGLAVINAEGIDLGSVAGLIETGANAVIRVIDRAGIERLLPFVSSVVLEVSLVEKRMRVDWGQDW